MVSKLVNSDTNYFIIIRLEFKEMYFYSIINLDWCINSFESYMEL